MNVDFKISGIDGVIRTLQSLPPEIVSNRGGPVKLSLAKGARFLRDQERAALRAVIAINGDESTGLLVDSIIASRGKAPTSGKGERYLVRIKRKSYPNREGATVTTLQTANLMEWGSRHQPATPFIRPTVQTYAQQTINIVVTDLNGRLDKIIMKLASQNRGR